MRDHDVMVTTPLKLLLFEFRSDRCCNNQPTLDAALLLSEVVFMSTAAEDEASVGPTNCRDRSLKLFRIELNNQAPPVSCTGKTHRRVASGPQHLEH